MLLTSRASVSIVVLLVGTLPLFGQCPSAPGLSVLDVSAEVAANSVLDSADGNIARAADATFFNSTWRGPAHNGHKAEFINDGVYGDCNQDGSVDLSDVICLLGFLFQNNPVNLPCINGVADLALMDVNNDLSIDLSDGIYTLAFLFQGGPGPAQGVNCFSIPGCPQNASCP